MTQPIRWCFNHNDFECCAKTKSFDAVGPHCFALMSENYDECDIGDMIPMRFTGTIQTRAVDSTQTPRQRWGTCCPNDPECEHSFLDAAELVEHLDTPIKEER